MIITQGNNAIMCGKVAKEPNKKVINKGDKTYQLIELSVVVGNTPDDKAIWANVYAWGTLLNSVKMGQTIFACGIKEMSLYTGRDGAEHQSTKYKIEYVSIAGGTNQKAVEQQADVETNKINNNLDDELPF